MTTSNHISPFLASVAEYRAAGCRWSVIAWRMEMPLEKLRVMVRAAGKAFRRRVRWLIRDRRKEEEMKEFARLRRELREALTETEARIAAEKLSALGLRLMRLDFQERRERFKRRARRLREEAKQKQEAPVEVVAPIAAAAPPAVRERRPRRAAVMRARYRRRARFVAPLRSCALATRKAISPVRVARPPPGGQFRMRRLGAAAELYSGQADSAPIRLWSLQPTLFGQRLASDEFEHVPCAVEAAVSIQKSGSLAAKAQGVSRHDLVRWRRTYS